ncbi:MAG: hypothetical protein RXP92_02760 [Candidatus Micrarchaeota archaeon]
MDRRNAYNKPGYAEELAKESGKEADLSKEYIKIGDALVRMPYRKIKMVTFTNIKKEELKDVSHAARLQYRLMLLDAVIKAWVNYAKGQISIIYNPVGADNIREKISLEDLISFLEHEGVHIDRSNMKERDFDYVEEFYSYAFNPKVIREHPPYGMSNEEWKARKAKLEEEAKEAREKKLKEFREWQKKYKEEHKDILADTQ